MAANAHPSPEQLTAYALGELSETELTAVAAHLAGCPACTRAAEQVPPDSFVRRVQNATPRPTGTRLAGDLPPGPAATSFLPAQSSPPESAGVADLPPELASHPKFRIVKELGRGGMGVVYLAEHRLMEKLVALKVISRSVLDHPEALARFHAEVRAAAQLDHKHIVRALDADCVRVAKRAGEAGASLAGDLHLLVMEYVEGRDLASVVAKQGPLPVAHACHYTRQAALGLQHAFERGMAHRDIKPHNLMLTPQGKVKVLDFGLARLRGQSGRQQLTKLDTFMGTPEYVAPEQATDARNADQRADIYALGCTLYFLLTGRPPFQEDTPVQTILAHLEKEPRPVHELRPDVPAGLAAVVAKMLAKDLARRYQRPADVANALAPFVKTAARTVPTALPAPRPSPPSPTQGTVLPEDTSRLPVARAGQETTAAMPTRPAAGPLLRPRRSWGGRLLYVALAVFAGVALAGGAAVWFHREALSGLAADSGKEAAPGPPEVADAQAGKDPPTGTPVFVALFDGKTIPAGWLEESTDGTAWKFEGGGLSASAEDRRGRAYFLSAKDYAHFVLRFKFQLEGKGAVAAVVVRAVPGERLPGPAGQLALDHPILRFGPVAGKSSWLRDGTNRQIEPDHARTLRAGWNELEVAVRGDSLRAQLNGELLTQVKRDAADKGGTIPGLARPHGRIGFLASRGTVRLKDVQVAELSGPRAAPPAAKDFVAVLADKAGWFEESAGCPRWAVQDGALVGTHPADTLGRTFLLSGQEYDNFLLQTEFRLEPNTNAAVVLRAHPGEVVTMARGGQALGHPVLRLSNSNRFPNLPTGSTGWLRDGQIDGQPDAPAPILPGWNRLTVEVRDDTLQATLNGSPLTAVKGGVKVTKSFIPGLARPRGRIGFMTVNGKISIGKLEVHELR